MPAPSEPTVRPAGPADHDAVLTTVLAAFDRDPAFRFFFPDPATFADQAAGFVAAVLAPRLASGGVWVADDGAAVAMWERPGAGGGGVREAVSPDAYDRLDRWERAAHRYIPDDEHWYLGILATHPSRAGEGLAARAAAPGLDLAARAGLTCWLETATATNVALYQRRGWTAVGATDVEGVTCTVMRRP